MTPTRLRQIADRMEQVCIEKRIVVDKVAVSCEGCKAASRELREYAEELGPKPNAKAVGN